MLVRTGWLILVALSLVSRAAFAADWSEEQVPKLPSGETAVRLFNGKDFSGWEGHVGKYFTVENGVIVGKNGKENAPRSSTYLLTKRTFRNFRLIFESRLVTSEMHSGIALWGKVIEKDEGPFTYQGHLVMYPSGYGYHDLFRRNSIYGDTLGVAKSAGKQHDWNRMEILAIGRRIRHVVNGRLVADWSDPQPELCGTGPIGLQLHSNTVPQEVQWRGLVLTENPQDRLVTATNRDAGLVLNGKPAESGMDEQALAKVGERMKEFVAARQIAGSVTLVARRGRIVHFEAVGKADVASGRDMAKDTLFAIASMNKPITAAAVMVLQDDGQLKLDDPVSKYIPAFAQTTLADGSKPAREITIRDCLRHTNGLDSDQRNIGTLAETVEALAKTKLVFEPGTKWKYGPGLSVAGRVVEVISGKAFDQFLAERILVPLDMKNSSYFPTADQLKRLAKLYQPTEDKKEIEPGEHWLFDFSTDRTPNPSGGLFSPADDIVRFYQMMLNGGELNGKRVLSADAVAQMTALQTPEMLSGLEPDVGWGLGFSIVREPKGGTAMVSAGTFGHGGAFGTQSWADPASETIYILMIARQKFEKDSPNLRAEFQKLAMDAFRN